MVAPQRPPAAASRRWPRWVALGALLAQLLAGEAAAYSPNWLYENPVGLPTAATAPGDSEWPGSGSVELSVGQALHGGLLGFEICSLTHCRQAALHFVAIGDGAGLLLGGLVGSRLRPHQAMLINSGTALGFFNSLALDWDQPKAQPGRWLGFQVGGALAGAIAGQFAHPETGRLAMANSAALWLATATYFGRHAANRENFGLWTAAAADLGYVFGLFAWDGLPLSRARVAQIDAAAGLGLTLGVLGAHAAVDRNDDHAMWVGGTVGVLAGVALGTLWADWRSAAAVQIVPQGNGVALMGTF